MRKKKNARTKDFHRLQSKVMMQIKNGILSTDVLDRMMYLYISESQSNAEKLDKMAASIEKKLLKTAKNIKL